MKCEAFPIYSHVQLCSLHSIWKTNASAAVLPTVTPSPIPRIQIRKDPPSSPPQGK